MSNLFEERFPEELEGVAGWLRAQRTEATPLELDQIKQRALARANQQHRRFGPVKARLATIFTILGLAGGTGGALAVAASSSSSSSNSSAASGSYKPGWGCGDTNHIHTGPPGNPGATSPCK